MISSFDQRKQATKLIYQWHERASDKETDDIIWKQLGRCHSDDTYLKLRKWLSCLESSVLHLPVFPQTIKNRSLLVSTWYSENHTEWLSLCVSGQAISCFNVKKSILRVFCKHLLYKCQKARVCLSLRFLKLAFCS